jgi:hypothetical protein
MHPVAYFKQHIHKNEILQARCIDCGEKCRSIHLYQVGKNSFLAAVSLFPGILETACTAMLRTPSPALKARRRKKKCGEKLKANCQ